MASDEKSRSRRGLDVLDVLMADLQTGIGPFLAIYLTSVRAWDPRTVGAVVSAQSLITVCAQAPGGALVDWITRKKWVLVVGAAMIAFGCLGIVRFHSVGMELVAQTMIGLAAAIFVPAVSAVSLGIVGRKELPRRVARNEIMYHVGNTNFGLVAGIVGEELGQHLTARRLRCARPCGVRRVRSGDGRGRRARAVGAVPRARALRRSRVECERPDTSSPFR